ncbi:MAG: YidC/Oxa1 family membrane protein insertase [Oscillospiraceae bacterium]|nr:YidC/Oxa1 family membrane protein insertase [Oscillospiraceae bacterium]MDE7094667.1 YidC/Oxa1 family membrane protein insertase [Oscillospiraceae bacterium]
MKWIYHLVSNYGIAIILFTFVTKMILFPISYKQQKSSARMQLLNPKLKKLQERYKNEPEKLQMEQMQLYQDENINPYSSCLTSFIPLLLLWGVLAVVYKPMTYILNYDNQIIEEAKAIVISIDEDPSNAEQVLQKNSMRQELVIMEKMLQNPEAFQAVVENGEISFIENDTEQKQAITSINADFVPEVTQFARTFTLGKANLSETPSTKISENSNFFLFLIPILSGLMQLLFTIYTQRMQKKRNPDMPSMGGMNAMLYIMPLFSVWLAFTVPAGVGFYWLCSSVFSFLQSVILFAWFNEERIEKIGEAERQKAKKSKRRPSMMQKLMEQQEELMKQQQQGNSDTASNRVRYSDSLHEEARLSRSEIKEYNTAVIREARKRMAEKYGDTSTNSAATGQDEKNSKKKK